MRGMVLNNSVSSNSVSSWGTNSVSSIYCGFSMVLLVVSPGLSGADFPSPLSGTCALFSQALMAALQAMVLGWTCGSAPAMVPLGGFFRGFLHVCCLKKAILGIKSRIFGQSYGCIWCKCGIISHILYGYLRQNGQNGQNDGPVDWVTIVRKRIFQRSWISSESTLIPRHCSCTFFRISCAWNVEGARGPLIFGLQDQQQIWMDPISIFKWSYIDHGTSMVNL